MDKPIVNIYMIDGSVLKAVNIFRSKELGSSIVSTNEEIEIILDGKSNYKTIFFGGYFVQGGLIPQSIFQYEIINDKTEKEMSKKINSSKTKGINI